MWKTPNELLKLQRLKQKKKALQNRVDKKTVEQETTTSLQVIPTGKRRNPFLKSSVEVSKKQRIDEHELNSEDTIFQLLQEPITDHLKKNQNENHKTTKLALHSYNIANLANLLQSQNTKVLEDNEEQKSSKYLPIDWSLKTRIRILCSSALPGTALKTNQEASGLTSFVRCIGPDSPLSGLDISPGARFHQTSFYWQHPHIPWLTLFPRNSKTNAGIQIGESEKTALLKEWIESFRGLFQLVRSRQCPYFYLCANSFVVLFRAAGIGGRVETHAIMTPTSRGMRNALKQEDIEYVQPFSKQSSLNKSGEASTSFEEQSQDGNKTDASSEKDENNDDDLEEEEWLESLGVDSSEIKKIRTGHFKQKIHSEMDEDFTESSLVVIEGVDCQAFFNFLLNSKSSIPNIGKLAGIPPTLLAPVAFPGATMRCLQTRSSKVRIDNEDYHSIELKGPILPHILPYISNLLIESKESFSATLTPFNNSLAFTKVSQKLIEDVEKENTTANQVFGKENLSDCGLPTKIIELMCRVNSDASCIMQRMWYNKDIGYTWS